MAERFDKFTEHARQVFELAQEEAQRLNHSYIGTEHLLLGIAGEPTGIAARVLVNLGVDLVKLRDSLTSMIGQGVRARTEMGLTPRAKTAIELSMAEARHLNHGSIGTEHLLLG